MEEIIGLLVLLAAAVFKAVNKKLEQSGEQALPGKPVRPEPLRETEREWKQEQEQTPAPAPAPTPVPVPKQQPAVARKQTQARKFPVQTEAPERKKEKIDPKKLIIYSEIMSPKCNEK